MHQNVAKSNRTHYLCSSLFKTVNNMPLIIPKRYKQKLLPETTEIAIKEIKDLFQRSLADALNLRRVTAPLFLLSGTGLNDDLNGVEHAVAFNIDAMNGARAEVVHSLAKWKRSKLAAYDIAPGYGLYTDMNAIRTFEDLDNLHSLYVDQWDWEKTIRTEDRTLDYLKTTVEKIYAVVREIEQHIYHRFPHITPRLPEKITFIHSEELLRQYPDKSPREREALAAKRHGAIFIIGIGAPLSNGEPDLAQQRRLSGPERRHYFLGQYSRNSFRAVFDGHTRQSCIPYGPARSPTLPRATQSGIPPFTSRWRTAAVDRRRYRPKPPVHVYPSESTYRRSSGFNMARRAATGMPSGRHGHIIIASVFIRTCMAP